MKTKSKLLALAMGASLAISASGCGTTPYSGIPQPSMRAGSYTQQSVTVNQNPHYGTENRDALEALGYLGQAVGHGNLSPSETNKNMNGLRGLGTLMDLLK